jgi:NTP pyrophosphatase (non-canonical NTP hydrolase)
MTSRINIIGQNGNEGIHYSCPSSKDNGLFDMDIDLYQNFTPTTAVYPMAGTRAIEEAMYLALGLNGEAGEVAEAIKKWWRDGKIDVNLLEKELGDVMWYVSQLANCFNLDLAEVLIKNRDKLIDRQNRGKLSGSGNER